MIEETNYTDFFSSFSEAYVEEMTNTYACLVTAMANCANYFGVFDVANFAVDYERLWTLSSTEVDHISDGITYGTTTNINAGPAFRTFCSEKGVTATVQYVPLIASYNFFKNCIDEGGIGIICTSINTEDGENGHGMTMEGYAQYISNDASARLHILRVADGWNSNVRYLNFEFDGYNYISGYAFGI